MPRKKLINSAHSSVVPSFYEAVENKPFDSRLPQKFRLIISGSSQSGKTFLAKNLILHAQDVMTEPPKEVFFFYQIEQGIFSDLKSQSKIPIHLHQGMPTDVKIEEILDVCSKPSLFIFDDFSHQLNRTIANLYQATSHHKNVQLITIVQNLFNRTTPFMRELSLSATGKISYRQL